MYFSNCFKGNCEIWYKYKCLYDLKCSGSKDYDFFNC